jgi:hypothetical protein
MVMNSAVGQPPGRGWAASALAGRNQSYGRDVCSKDVVATPVAAELLKKTSPEAPQLPAGQDPRPCAGHKRACLLRSRLVALPQVRCRPGRNFVFVRESGRCSWSGGTTQARGARAERRSDMTGHKPGGVPRAAGELKASSVILMVVLVDLLVIVPFSYWRLSGHRLALIIAYTVEGVGMLSLLGIALYLRRRGS